MTSRFLGILILSLTCQINAFGSPKIALVRVKDIYLEQAGTKAAQEKARKAKESVLLDPRAEELREVVDALRELQKKIVDRQKRPTEEEGRKLTQEFEIKRLETQTLQEDFERFSATREKEINAEMVHEMRTILDRIVELSQRIAEEKGYQLVIDSSGNTNSSVPFVLYSKNSPELTDDVLAAIKNDQVSPEGAASPITSEPTTPDRSPEKPADP